MLGTVIEAGSISPQSVEKQYYKHKTGVIPYLWYPPEFFETHTYGKSLDVWSYGITCCEIFNNAEVSTFVNI